MLSLDWIPVICKTIGRDDVGRRYMRNRLHELKQALDEWLKQQRQSCQDMRAVISNRQDKTNYAALHGLLAKELALLRIAVSNIEVWSGGGSDMSLAEAQQAYRQAQIIWRRRLNLLQKIPLFPYKYQ